LIRRARLRDGRTVDLRIARGRIAAVVPHDPLAVAEDGARAIDARGGLALPGLHDHHIHIAATAASLSSIRCGPPDVIDEAGLAAALLTARAATASPAWLRGIGYHESVAGMIDRQWLDRIISDRPVRVQHRSGRMWIFNSAGLAKLLSSGIAPPAELDRGNGQLFDADGWLRQAIGSGPPDFAAVGTLLARRGITGITDMNPQNDADAAQHFAQQRALGAFPQRVLMAGQADMGGTMPAGVTLGPVKLHLHEAHLPEYDATVAAIRDAHDRGRGMAVHCVTETELVFTLAALRDAGAIRSDRIEHASVAPDELVGQIAALGIAVVSQPRFVAERGDAYLADIPPEEWPYLYRLRAFRAAGVTLAGSSDAPFGSTDPWAAMTAAVTRQTASGAILGKEEALTPEEALALFLADPEMPDRIRQIEPGAPADICLLRQDWPAVRENLREADIYATLIQGIPVDIGVSETP
jgi:predicted amidohydrolase YtcJ